MSFSQWDFIPDERDRLSSKTNSTIQSQEESLPSDAELIKSAQAGNEVAFDLVYERYYHKIHLFLIRMLFDRGIAEELTQETFIKAWKALLTLRDPTKFLNWLYRIATHEVQNYYRRPGVLPRGPSNQTLGRNVEVSISGPDELVEAQEHVRWALSRVVPEKCRACLILYHIQGRPIAQIAEDLGIKQSSVRQYISSGLNQLKHILEVDDASREER